MEDSGHTGHNSEFSLSQNYKMSSWQVVGEGSSRLQCGAMGMCQGSEMGRFCAGTPERHGGEDRDQR